MEITPEYINVFLSKCKSSNWAGVFFSGPFETQFQFWLHDLSAAKQVLEEKFVFSPFDITDSPALVLHPHKKNAEAILQLGELQNKFDYWQNDQLSELESTSIEQYHQQFERYISLIRSGNCKKAILSTIVKQKLPVDLNFGNYVFKLRKEYPQAFVYLYSSPFAGTWIGATPETLLRWRNKEVSTMSLAGTKKIDDEQFNFGEKEKIEQQIVSEYISNIFKNRFTGVEQMGREEFSYGEMTHLLTRVKTLVDHRFTSHQFLELATELHPTPAVGGFPVKSALNLIKSTEIHPRLYYSGFLGIIGSTSGELAVNLRCMSLFNGCLYAFAGGGITADSSESSEWAETRLKANALLKFL